MNVDELKTLLPWCTTTHQQTVVKALIEHGTSTAAGRALDMRPNRIRDTISQLRQSAARRGFSPAHDMTHTVPGGFHVRGVSTMYDGDGNIRAQWVKSGKDEEDRFTAFSIALDALLEEKEVRGRAKPVKAPKVSEADLLNCIQFGDPHFGMQSWHHETGEDFDLRIARRDMMTGVDTLIEAAQPAKNCLIVSLGDMFHSDSNAATTTRGTRVDVDTRWAKTLGVGIATMRYCIDRALEKHHHVTFVPVCGNHDQHSSLMMGIALAQFYEREPRVTVDTSPNPFHWYRHGKVLIGMTHGDTVKREQLPGIMACDRPMDWAECTHRYWLTGHIHHETVKEFPGVIVETFRTLASRDAWHHASGYRSGRDIRLDVYCKNRGRVNRHIVGLQEIQAKNG